MVAQISSSQTLLVPSRHLTTSLLGLRSLSGDLASVHARLPELPAAKRPASAGLPGSASGSTRAISSGRAGRRCPVRASTWKYSIGNVPRTCGLIDTNGAMRSEEHTSELQSLMRISYDAFCLQKKNEHKE